MVNQLTQKQASLHNFSMFYLQGGLVSDLAPILFLPGWGVSVETYLESLNALSQRYCVIALDLPSFCKSTSPGFLQN